MGKSLKKKIERAVGKAISDWKMIRSDEKILLGLSGGKDSQVLLDILVSLQKKAPVHFDILPVHIDAGFQESFAEDLGRHVAHIYGLKLEIVYRRYGLLAHSPENRENPCFLCSRLRRNHLFEMARAEGRNRIALGHNKDDIIETLFINMCYTGKMAAMKPRQSFFGGGLDIIRPLAYAEKDDIERYARTLGLPEFTNPCPSAGKTRRSAIRSMLDVLYQHNSNIKGNIFRSMGNVVPEYLLDHQS